MVNINQVKRSYFLNLFSGNAQIENNINDVSAGLTFITGTTLISGGGGYTEAPIVKVPELNYYGNNGIQSNLANITSVLTPTGLNSNNYTILSRGSNYANNDQLVLGNTAAGGSNGDVKAVVSSGLITAYTAFNGGSGYVNAPTISATGGGSGFTAVSFLTPTTISSTFTITNGGSGYNTGDILNFDNTDTGCILGTIAYMNGETPVYCVSVSATIVCNASGVITGINLINAGIGYTKKAPIISSITKVGASIGTGYIMTCSLVPTSVASIQILTSGTGYSTSPTIVFTAIGAGSGASATPTITNGAITSLLFSNIGSYTLKAPLITSITSASGAGASIVLNLNPTSVASLTINDGGSANSFITSPPPNMSLQFTSTNGLGSGAVGNVITRTTRNKIFKWNIRDLHLGRVAEIALVQMCHTNAHNNTGYAIRCLETFADGFDSYNHTSAILYLGMGLNTPSVPTYHKLISQNLNTITLLCTQDLTSSKGIYSGISDDITFSAVFEVIDYIDENQNY
jgi:hypothetical protein